MTLVSIKYISITTVFEMLEVIIVTDIGDTFQGFSKTLFFGALIEPIQESDGVRPQR